MRCGGMSRARCWKVKHRVDGLLPELCACGCPSCLRLLAWAELLCSRCLCIVVSFPVGNHTTARRVPQQLLQGPQRICFSSLHLQVDVAGRSFLVGLPVVVSVRVVLVDVEFEEQIVGTTTEAGGESKEERTEVKSVTGTPEKSERYTTRGNKHELTRTSMRKCALFSVRSSVRAHAVGGVRLPVGELN